MTAEGQATRPDRDQSQRFTIRTASSPQDVADARHLMERYYESLGLDMVQLGFAAELAALPGRFDNAAGGVLLVARDATTGLAVGCAGIRALPPQDCLCVPPLVTDADSMCELKRVYVEAPARGTGLGRRLVETALEAAATLGYEAVLLDTLIVMAAATRLYQQLGFEETEAYNATPLEARFFVKRLR